MHIGLLVIATQRYIRFVPPLVASARQHFLSGHQVEPVVFTDQPAPPGTRRIAHAHQPWPMPTLMRYHAFWAARDVLGRYDALYYCDADMVFVDRVGPEVIGDIVAVEHPYYAHRRRAEFTYEARPESTAFVPDGVGTRYYMGGFQGGRTDAFLEASRELSANIDLDLEREITAVWHDESHWNRYLADRPPSVTLDSTFCHPEGGALEPRAPRLIALAKDHARMRRETPARRLVRWVRGALGRPS